MAPVSCRNESGGYIMMANRHYSCNATSVLRLQYHHLFTATIPQGQQSSGIMLRPYLRISVIFPDIAQVLFTDPNRFRHKCQSRGTICTPALIPAHPFSKETVFILAGRKCDPSFSAFFPGSRIRQEGHGCPAHDGLSVCF